MLVLTRKRGEKIYIGNSIVITNLGHDRGSVKLGIHAPKEINIVRNELIDESILDDNFFRH